MIARTVLKLHFPTLGILAAVSEVERLAKSVGRVEAAASRNGGAELVASKRKSLLCLLCFCSWSWKGSERKQESEACLSGDYI